MACLGYVVYGPKMREDEAPRPIHERVCAIFVNQEDATAYAAYKNDSADMRRCWSWAKYEVAPYAVEMAQSTWLGERIGLIKLKSPLKGYKFPMSEDGQALRTLSINRTTSIHHEDYSEKIAEEVYSRNGI